MGEKDHLDCLCLLIMRERGALKVPGMFFAKKHTAQQQIVKVRMEVELPPLPLKFQLF